MAYGLKALVAFPGDLSSVPMWWLPVTSGSSAREPVPPQCIAWCTDIGANKTPV